MEFEERKPMTGREILIANFGQFSYGGRHYLMVSVPFTYATREIMPYYQATAVCEEDVADLRGFRPVYTVNWTVTDPGQIAYFTAMLEGDKKKADQIALEEGVDPDQVLCDFNKPRSIQSSAYIYNIDQLRQIFEWE